MVSLVENELFLMPSSLALACAVIEGDANSRKPKPVAAAAPARAVPARNFRRFKYKPLGVISDEGMSADFSLIHMKTVLLISVRERAPCGLVISPRTSDRTLHGPKRCKR